MESGNFFEANGSALIAVLGTIVGVLIASFFNWLHKRSEWKNQKQLRKLERSIEFQKQNLIDPIIQFIETELMLIQTMFKKGFAEKSSPNEFEMFKEHNKKILLTSAKIKVYGNSNINKKFEEYTRKRVEIMNYISNESQKDLTSAYEVLKAAEDIASAIIKSLKDDLENFES